VPRQDAGLASGLVNSSRQIGASVGLAVLSTVAATHISSLLAGRTVVTDAARRVAMTAGYARGFLIASIVALAGGVLALIIPRQVLPVAVPAAEAAAATDAPLVPSVEG
jgi:hypothetical protein